MLVFLAQAKRRTEKNAEKNPEETGTSRNPTPARDWASARRSSGARIRRTKAGRSSRERRVILSKFVMSANSRLKGGDRP
jgi:hypothetical protein